MCKILSSESVHQYFHMFLSQCYKCFGVKIEYCALTKVVGFVLFALHLQYRSPLCTSFVVASEAGSVFFIPVLVMKYLQLRIQTVIALSRSVQVLYHYNPRSVHVFKLIIRAGLGSKHFSGVCSLVPRVLWLFGQRMGASRDSGFSRSAHAQEVERNVFRS